MGKERKMERKTPIIGTIKQITDELQRLNIPYRGLIIGSRFEIEIISIGSLAKGSGIAGDRQWFWITSCKDAMWEDIRPVQD